MDTLQHRKQPQEFFKHLKNPHRVSDRNMRLMAATGTQYNLVARNNSSATWNFYMYQQQPGPPSPGVFSLAWFVLPVAPSTQVKFTWTIDYDFVWSSTGTLKPGVIFHSSQSWDADPTTANIVNFGLNNGNAPTFSSLGSGGSPGSLTINQDSTVVPGNYTVGIGMSGAGTFVTQAQPNTAAVFTPEPSYWISFGSQIQQGQVLTTVVGDNAPIVFPFNVYTMYATLGQDNLWKVLSSPPAP